MPRVSVIMPVYNTPENYLREAINSILNQTYSDFEFIIINDGSTTGVEQVILSYKDSRIIYVKNEQNLKLIKTLNKGLCLAKGEYVVRMDSDDISVENRIEKSVEFMDKNPNIGAASTYAYGTPKKVRYMLPEKNEVIRPFLRYVANCIMHPSVIMRTAILKEKNLSYDEKYIHNEDYKLWIDINLYSELANIPEFLLIHRLHEKSVSVQYAKEQKKVTQKILLDNLLSDFAPKDKKLSEIFEKYFGVEQFRLSEFQRIDKFFCKIIKKLKKTFAPEIYPYLYMVYADIYVVFAQRTDFSIFLVMQIWFSRFLHIIEKGIGFKKMLTIQLLNKLECNSEIN